MGFTGRIAALWASVCVIALASWFVDPDIQHVLQFSCGGIWSAAVIAMFVRSRTATGRQPVLWALIVIGAPTAILITMAIMLTWEVLSPLGLVISTPIRMMEVFLAFSIGRLGSAGQPDGALT